MYVHLKFSIQPLKQEHVVFLVFSIENCECHKVGFCLLGHHIVMMCIVSLKESFFVTVVVKFTLQSLFGYKINQGAFVTVLVHSRALVSY